MSKARNLSALLASDGQVEDAKIDSVAASKLSGTIDTARLPSANQTSKLPLTGGAMTGAITTNSTFDTRDVATDGTKLDTIETSAKDDQTAAQIKTLYEGEVSAFTDAQFTKLGNIESNATADQTNAEIKAAVEAATDSNTFTDADHTKLNDIEASADVTDTANVTSAGALMDSELAGLAAVKATTGTFLTADQTKLDTIETNADVTDTTNVVAALSAGTGVGITGAGVISVTAVALTTVQTAANQTAHLALTAQEGDIVVRSDENKSYVHNSGSAGTMADYTLLATPTDAVLSINGVTGAVTAAQIATAVEAATDSNTFTDADHTKLNSVTASANLYVHPNHSGDVTSTADGATVIGANKVITSKILDDNVTAAKLANSINTDIATGVTGNTTANNALPKAGGTMTGPIYFDRDGGEVLWYAEDAASTNTIYCNVNDGQGNFGLMLGVDGAGASVNSTDGVAKFLMQGHGTAGVASLNAAPVGSTVSFSAGIVVDSTDNTLRVGASSDAVGLAQGAGTKIADMSGNLFTAGIPTAALTVGTTAPSSPAQGNMWYDTTTATRLLKIYTGTVWETVSNVQPGSSASNAAVSIAAMYNAGVASGTDVWMTLPSYNSGTAFKVKYMVYDSKGWIEVLWSSNSDKSAMYSGSKWHPASGNSAMVSHSNAADGSMQYTGTSSSIAVGTDFGITDFALTTKSSVGGYTVAATGQNETSSYPIRKANITGTSAATARTAVLAYWDGSGSAIHLGNDSSGTGWYTDAQAHILGSGSSNHHELMLGRRGATVPGTEWGIDGLITPNATYAPNWGYRDSTASYGGAWTGSWSSGSAGKAAAYNIDTGNVLSVWITSM